MLWRRWNKAPPAVREKSFRRAGSPQDEDVWAGLWDLQLCDVHGHQRHQPGPGAAGVWPKVLPLCAKPTSKGAFSRVGREPGPSCSSSCRRHPCGITPSLPAAGEALGARWNLCGVTESPQGLGNFSPRSPHPLLLPFATRAGLSPGDNNETTFKINIYFY